MLKLMLSLSEIKVRGVTVDAVVLRLATSRKSFQDEMFLPTQDSALIAFTPK